jgi:hypothetical protein
MYTLQGKPDTHATYTSYAGPRMPLIRFSRTVPVRENLSRRPNRVGRTLLLPRKRDPNTIFSTSADQSAGPPPSFFSYTTIEAVMKVKHLLTNMIYRFTRPISPTYDQYVQYLLVGANPSVLNRHKRGLQPWRYRLATSHSPTFPIDGPPLST